MIHKFGSAVFTLLLAALVTPNAGHSDEPVFREVASWLIKVDTSIGNGCFTHAQFEGDTEIRIGFIPADKTDPKSLYFMIGDSDWTSLKSDSTYDLEVSFGDEDPWTGAADTFDMGGDLFLTLMVSGNQIDLFLQEFMQEQYVDVRYKNASIATLELEDSYKAGIALGECQSLLEQTSQARAGGPLDPFAEDSNDQSFFEEDMTDDETAKRAAVHCATYYSIARQVFVDDKDFTGAAQAETRQEQFLTAASQLMTESEFERRVSEIVEYQVDNAESIPWEELSAFCEELAGNLE